MENEQKVIGVLAGGYSSERDISLASGKTALQAFEEAGYQVLFVELDREGFKVNGQLVKISDLGPILCIQRYSWSTRRRRSYLRNVKSHGDSP